MKKYQIQKKPFIVPTTDGKIIAEHHGLAATNNSEIPIARMIAPPHWSEPFRKPEFDEYTFIISGKKQFNIDGDSVILSKGESIMIPKNARVRYENPFDEPCEYLSVCVPAFSIKNVNREE